MSASSFAGAPLSKAIVLSTVALSVLAAAASFQHHLALSLAPHLTRDHQLYRLVTHHLAYANSSELLLGTLVLWQTSPGLERLFGTRKFAASDFLPACALSRHPADLATAQSFIVITTVIATLLEVVALGLGWRLSKGTLNSFPSGPFALVSAIAWQSHRLVPTLYHFRLFHAVLTLSNRFPTYLLWTLFTLSEPPSATLLPSLCGLVTSIAYSSNLLSLKDYRLPRRFYHACARVGARVFGSDAASRARVRRGTAVTAEEALLQSVAASALAGPMMGGARGNGGGGGGGGGGVNGLAGGMDASILRSMGRATRQQEAAAATAAAAARAGGGRSPSTTATLPSTEVERLSATAADSTLPASPQAESGATPAGAGAAAAVGPARPPSLSRLTGASFLREWQAGLTGAPEGPSAAQINELTSIFPHHTRHAIVAALLQSELDTSRAAEILLAQQT
ncbi:hypothetical protein BMF94_0744 [Rhodotorula taiwanensis]|uniref:CUE domain-containing protein n=1 Tax=Rhodotorula taiwanensis TaxID=741276 RepID=A0A2S5BGX8_9BASI|nr:hypothetical protein BMF94_0744 [Rhodotorula taiwanensis]